MAPDIAVVATRRQPRQQRIPNREGIERDAQHGRPVFTEPVHATLPGLLEVVHRYVDTSRMRRFFARILLLGFMAPWTAYSNALVPLMNRTSLITRVAFCRWNFVGLPAIALILSSRIGMARGWRSDSCRVSTVFSRAFQRLNAARIPISAIVPIMRTPTPGAGCRAHERRARSAGTGSTG